MQIFEDQDEVELMTADFGMPLGTRGKVLGPKRGFGNWAGTGHVLVGFEAHGAINIPENCLSIVNKHTKPAEPAN